MISKLKKLIFKQNISKLDYIYFDFKKYVCDRRKENDILINKTKNKRKNLKLRFFLFLIQLLFLKNR